MGNMHITVDARCSQSGIGAYVSHVLHGLHQEKNGFRIRALVRGQDASRFATCCDEVRILDTPIYSLREQFTVPRAAAGSDLLHVPHYNAPLRYKGPMLVSICDLIHITDPTFRRRPESWLYAFPMLKMVTQRATHIITLSHFSKGEIVNRLGVAPEKVSVTYCGADEHFHARDKTKARAVVRERFGWEEPYLLFVGNFKPHKNLTALVRAFGVLREKSKTEIRLVLIGDDLRGKTVVAREIQNLQLEKTVSIISEVDIGLLANLYAGAELLVMPSTLEGFGLPVLEAMACGTAVVCSNAASLPEVAGDAAEYFDPYSVEDMAATLHRVLASPSRMRELELAGLSRTKQFSWKQCAEEHAQIYSRMTGNA